MSTDPETQPDPEAAQEAATEAAAQAATPETATPETPAEPAPDASAAEPPAAEAAAGDDAGADAAPDAEAPDAPDSGEEGADAPEEPPAPPEPSAELIARVSSLFTRSPASAADPDPTPDADGEADAPAEASSADALEDGPFRFARWARPIAPRIFGAEPASAEILTQGFKAVGEAAGLPVAVEDETYGANALVFVCADWAELKDTPSLDRLIPDLAKLVTLLSATGANQYRIFGFDADGALDIAIVLLRIDDELGAFSGEAVALSQAVQTALLWSDRAFVGDSPIRVSGSGRASLDPVIAALLAAAYAEETPVASDDPALADTLARAVAARAPRSGRGADSRRGGRRRRGGGRRRSAGDTAAGPAADG